MTIATYSELVTELGAYLNRSDLTARIPTFVRLFEARMNRLLTDPAMAVTSTTSLSADEDTYALPDDFLKMRGAYLTTDPKTVLEAMSPQQLRLSYADSATGQPRAFAVIGESIVVAPTPDGTYSLVLDYFQAIPSLESNSTNWLMDAHPDAYLFGTLCQAQAYMQDDPRLAVWKQAWDEAVGEIIKLTRRKALPAGPLAMRPTVSE